MNNNQKPAPSLHQQLMDQAQVYASAWSMVGGPFDAGDQLERAEEEKEGLSGMIGDALEHLAAQRDQLLEAFEVLNGWHARQIDQLKVLETAGNEGVEVRLGDSGTDITLTKESATGLKLGVLTAIQLLGKLPVTVNRAGGE